MSESEVVVKGEVHTSRADLEEERDLLIRGVDTLIIEGQRRDADFSLSRSWYGTALLIFQWVIARNLYTDTRLLIDLADAQGANIQFTRETDAEIIENVPQYIEASSAGIFYILLVTSVIYGLFFGEMITGALILLLSALLPILILRSYETIHADRNRDEIMAQNIEDAVAEGGRVITVLGKAHYENIPEYLSDDLDPEYRPPKHGAISFNTLRDIGIPVFEAFSDLFLLYVGLLLFVEIVLMVL